MDLLKYKKLRYEFPFLEETVIKNDAGGSRYNLKYLDFLRVELATPIILGKMPRKYLWPGTNSSSDKIIEWEQVHFVLNDNEIMRNAVRQHVTSQYYDHLGETVSEAITNYRIVWSLRFIVLTEGGYNIFQNRSLPNFRSTIYRLKKGTTYNQLLDEAEKGARDWEKSYYHNPYGFSC